MTRVTPYFELLDDRLVQSVIRCIPVDRYTGGWRCLSLCCRRLCILVRITRRVSMHADPEGVLQLVKVPSYRAFSQVKVLHLDGHSTGCMQQWVQFADAAAAAAAAWGQLEEVALSGELVNTEHECVPGCLSSVLLALRAAPALRRLRLVLAESYSLVYLPALTQLQELELEGTDDLLTPVSGSGHCRPLAGMTSVVSLRLRSLDVSLPLPCALPVNVTRLELDGCWLGAADWAAHIATCKQLQELHLEASACTVNSHPTVLLQALAEQVTGLVQLRVWQDGVEPAGGQQRLQEALGRMQPVAGIEAPEEDWLPVPPLTAAQGHPDAEEHVMVLPPNMGGLSALQQLHLSNWWLVVSTEQCWRTLAGCSSLRSLEELHASVPPPAGVTFHHLTRLVATVSTSPGDTVTLLGAFPAAKELELTVVPQGGSVLEAATAPPAVPTQLVTAAISLLEPLQLPAGDRAQCLAAYCSSLWGATPGLRSLTLSWPSHVQLLQHLPSMCALRQLSALVFKHHSAHVAADASLKPLQPAVAQQLVVVLRALPQLRLVQLPLGLAPRTAKDQLVLGLKQALPGLKLVRM